MTDGVKNFLDTAELNTALAQIENGVISYTEVKEYFTSNNQ